MNVDYTHYNLLPSSLLNHGVLKNELFSRHWIQKFKKPMMRNHKISQKTKIGRSQSRSTWSPGIDKLKFGERQLQYSFGPLE